MKGFIVEDEIEEKFTIKLRVNQGKLANGIICESKRIDIDYTVLYDYLSNGYIFDNTLISVLQGIKAVGIIFKIFFTGKW